MELYNIEISEFAQNDLKELFIYIKNQLLEPIIALKLIDKIEAQFLTLETMPKRHSIIDSEPFRTNQIRKFPIENYIAFYTVSDDVKTIYIVRILYGRRNWLEIM